MKKSISIFCLLVFLPAAGAQGLWANEKELQTVLAKTGAYCKRLMDASLHYFCIEKVSEQSRVKEYFKQYMDYRYSLRRSGNKKDYKYNYQLFKEGDQITEKRSPAKAGAVADPQKQGKDAKSTIQSFKSSLSPYYLFADENRKGYRYKLLGKEAIMKRNAYMVEVKRKNDPKFSEPFAVAWIDTKDFSILKIHAHPKSIKGYENFQEGGKHRVSDVIMSDIHYYGVKSGGIRFPSRTEVLLLYTYNSPRRWSQQASLKAGARVLKRIETVFSYNDYRFFKVEVGEPQVESAEDEVAVFTAL